MDGGNRPPSQIFREAAEDGADKEAAAQRLEDSKSAIMAQWQAELGDMPVNKAEQTVKSSLRWMDLLEKIVAARKAANLAKINMEVRRMEFNEWSNREANQRQELRMTS